MRYLREAPVGRCFRAHWQIGDEPFSQDYHYNRLRVSAEWLAYALLIARETMRGTAWTVNRGDAVGLFTLCALVPGDIILPDGLTGYCTEPQMTQTNATRL